MAINAKRNSQWLTRQRPLFARSLLIVLPVIFLFVFFLIPIGQMLTISFQPYNPQRLTVHEFTLENYLALLTDGYLRSLLLRTLVVSAISTVVCAIVAYPIAYQMRQTTGNQKLLISLIVFTPMMVSLVVLGYSWIVILAPNNGLVNTSLRALGLPPAKIMFTKTGIVLGLVYTNAVFMIISLHTALENIGEDLLRGARILGANSVQLFQRVILPLSLPGLVSGSLIVFSISASSFVMPSLLGGRQTPVLATYAYDQATYYLNWPMASALAAAMGILTGVLNLLYTSWIRRVERRLGILDEEASA